MELTDYIRILRKNWIAIILITLLGLGSAAVFSLTRTPQFEASSTVFVSTQSDSSVQDLQQGNSFTLARVNTYTNLVSTPLVVAPVIEKLGLNTTADKLAEHIAVSSPLNTTLITITVTESNATQAADIANALGASLTTAVEKVESPNAGTQSLVRLTTVRDATAPLLPSSPNVPLNLALGLLVGLALGIGYAVLRTVLDTRLRTPRDVEQVTDAPIIGAIANDPKAPERPLIVHVDPLSPRAESFRTLRTNLQFLDMGGRSSFVVTSSMPSEGKSTTSINLAIALADAGKKVALLDTDLRKPKVAEYLGIEGGAGLTDVLIGRARVGDVMLPWGGRSLYVLPAGKIPPNPSELLGSDQMRTLLAVLERDFDVVLCDAPPLLPVTDGAILAKATSGAIIVVAAGRTNQHQLSGAIDSLETVGAKVAGITLTMVATRGPDAYYTYGYGYAHEETLRERKRLANARPGARRRGGATRAAVMPPQPSRAGRGAGHGTSAGAEGAATATPAPAAPAAARQRSAFDDLLTPLQADDTAAARPRRATQRTESPLTQRAEPPAQRAEPPVQRAEQPPAQQPAAQCVEPPQRAGQPAVPRAEQPTARRVGQPAAQPVEPAARRSDQLLTKRAEQPPAQRVTAPPVRVIPPDGTGR
ncbi:hypothetical protein GCM10022240_14680 [Microbacterium kribbense]|uniref:non-specific protein-tyrosine kinase n=2 Tax=Microbacterium kribbense TaxID=433645 RepID=A0ABP7GFV8_9MICO